MSVRDLEHTAHAFTAAARPTSRRQVPLGRYIWMRRALIVNPAELKTRAARVGAASLVVHSVLQPLTLA